MNVLYQQLPEEINGWKMNFDFRIGIQVALVQEDQELNARERWHFTIALLFGEEDGSIREFPQDAKELEYVVKTYMTGWNLDHTPKQKENQRLMDYNIDQWRIYADFRQVYGINLNDCDLHFWEFQAMLWNMPHRQSSFLQAVEIRGKKYEGMSAPEKKALAKAKKIYALEQPEEEMTAEEEERKDEFMAAYQRGIMKDEIVKEFLHE